MIDMVELSLKDIIIAFVTAMSIPSAIMGVIVWKLERRIAKQEKDAEDREANREKLLLLVVQGTTASIALSEATAKAVQRIPDAHCNGDMKAALEYASDIKHQQKDFLAKQGIHALWE